MNYEIPALKPISSIVIKLEESPLWKTTTQTNTPLAIEHKVVKGDSLQKIADDNSTTVERIFSKNTDIENPDIIEVGQTIIIPTPEEELVNRPLPAKTQPEPIKNAPRLTSGGRFPYGWCTFYSSQQRPDLQVSGNAGTWIRFANSKTPQIGAVAINTKGLGHVAIVKAINGNMILVKHMNYHGFGVISEDWISTSYWSGYIL